MPMWGSAAFCSDLARWLGQPDGFGRAEFAADDRQQSWEVKTGHDDIGVDDLLHHRRCDCCTLYVNACLVSDLAVMHVEFEVANR